MLHKTIVRYKSGVYKITNIINNKIYIGSSVNLYNRFHTHCSKLKHGNHRSKHLQSSYDKYGKDNFIFEVIEYCEKDVCEIREQYYLDLLGPSYNKRRDATLNTNVLVSKESREKISSSLKLLFSSGKRIGKCYNNTPVILFDLHGKIVMEFSSYKKCGDYLGLNANTISCVANGYRKRVKKNLYIVLKKSEAENISNYININPHGKRVKVIDNLLNTEHLFCSLVEAANYLKYKKTESLINSAKRGKILRKRYLVIYN